jgi:hypothetical protein
MKGKRKLIFILILTIGLLFRFTGINWDNNSHLHPDERFLTMVGTAMKTPRTLGDYLDPHKSTFNPTNIGYNFFVYGTFPLTLNKVIALSLGNDNYDNFTIQGRALSAMFDFAVVASIFLAVYMLERKYKLDHRIKFYASLIYAVSVLPIQLSHFFAVDTFLNTFIFLSFTSALFYWTKNKMYGIFISAVFFGLALSCKITALYGLPLIFFFLIHFDRRKLQQSIARSLVNFLFFGIFSFITLRLAYPYVFESGSILSLGPNKALLTNLKELQNLSSKESMYPPMVQWIHKTIILFPLKNIIIWGFGIPAFCVFMFGAFKTMNKRVLPLILILIWMCFFFLYQGSRITSTMRYFIMLYPFMAIFTGIGLSHLHQSSQKLIFYLALVLIFIWPLMFFSIYAYQNSRVAASVWINKNIPQNSIILSEYWDDALPLGSISTNTYKVIETPVFDPDTGGKWEKINNLLATGDYLILSSNRGWGSIPTVPERYPIMTRFYENLFADKLSYKKVAEFTSYPSLSYLGIPITIPDDSSEEAFTVYDHPKVMIFKHIR